MYGVAQEESIENMIGKLKCPNGYKGYLAALSLGEVLNDPPSLAHEHLVNTAGSQETTICTKLTTMVAYGPSSLALQSHEHLINTAGSQEKAFVQVNHHGIERPTKTSS